MGLHAIPISQKTLESLEAVFAKDGITVESLDVSEEERTNDLIGRYRCRSEQGGVVVLCIQPYDRYPPFEMICTVQFGEGFVFTKKHDKLYSHVVDRLQELAKSKE